MEGIIIPALAGLLAGLGTGFAGLSAAVFIAPMLTVFLKLDTFSSVGIALASDVLASAFSAITYYRHGNTALRENRLLMAVVVIFAIIGSAAAHIFTGLSVGESIMSWWLIAASLLLGIKLLLFPAKEEKKRREFPSSSKKLVMIFCGAYIGFVCGFQGTGGGLMLLFTLNILLEVPFKKAVGTSVSVMAVTALIGAVSHFTMRDFPDFKILLLSIVFTLIGAGVAATVANRIQPLVLKRITGGLMSVSGFVMVVMKFLS